MAKKSNQQVLVDVKVLEEYLASRFNPNSATDASTLVTPPPVYQKKVKKLAKTNFGKLDGQVYKFKCSHCPQHFKTESGAQAHVRKNGDCSTWKTKWNRRKANA